MFIIIYTAKKKKKQVMKVKKLCDTVIYCHNMDIICVSILNTESKDSLIVIKFNSLKRWKKKTWKDNIGKQFDFM